MNNPGSEPPLIVLSPNTQRATSSPKSTSRTAAIAGGIAGAVLLVLITLTLVCLSLLRARRASSRQSDTSSSEPSIEVVWAKRPGSPLGAFGPAVSEAQSARYFSLAELEHASKQWDPNNMIGVGGFGLVFKGLLEDGTIVAIKKRPGTTSQQFAAEVKDLSRVRHKHVVILIGYCQEDDQQILVYDYLPNGSVNTHLYDSDGHSLGKLDFKQRISIALGAAKGLNHLHSLVPPLIHGDFKTSNVLVDENFVPKVTDYGMSRLMVGIQNYASSSTAPAIAISYQDPECLSSQVFNQKSDVYSFGVFLLELISGREVISTNKPHPEWSLVDWARYLLERRDLGALVDSTLGGNFTEAGIKSLLQMCFQCIEPRGDKRPDIKEVMNELEDILQKESGFTSWVEGSASVVLGSELFLRKA